MLRREFGVGAMTRAHHFGLLLGASAVGCMASASGAMDRAPAALRPDPATTQPIAASLGANIHAPADTHTGRHLDLSEMAEEVFPSVVLLLAYHADGTTHYGAGFWIGDGGLVLTSLHVVSGARSLGAILYRKDRTSYTPMDGGLTRYVFENQSEIVGATMVDADRRHDLALIRISAERPSGPKLEIAREPSKVGERVFAVGHPQETAWSITTGWITALPNGAIEHDATVSFGSSGGPLLNERGQVIGVSVAKVTSEPQGFAFARPIAMASAWIETSIRAVGLDLSSPEKTVLSCWHAWEMASPEVVDCFDWDGRWAVYVSAIEALSERLSPQLRAHAFADPSTPKARATWIADQKQQMLKRLREGPEVKQDKPSESDRVCMRDPVGLARHRVLDELKTEDERLSASWQKENGFKEDIHDHRALLEIIRRGIRIEAIDSANKDGAWVMLAGRNRDGSTYRFAEYYVKLGEQWVQRSPPLPKDRATLPKGWPPPIEDHQVLQKRLMLGMLDRIEPQG